MYETRLEPLMLKPALKPYKYAGLVVYGNKSIIKMKKKEEKDHDHSLQNNQVENFTVSLWVKRREKLPPLRLLPKDAKDPLQFWRLVG